MRHYYDCEYVPARLRLSNQDLALANVTLAEFNRMSPGMQHVIHLTIRELQENEQDDEWATV